MDDFIRAAAWMLMAVVALVLLLACTNLASFVLARALDRRKGSRVALGAGRVARVAGAAAPDRDDAAEPAAGAAGIGLAGWLLDLLVTVAPPLPLPVTLDALALPDVLLPSLHHRLVGLGRRRERPSERDPRGLVSEVEVRPDPRCGVDRVRPFRAQSLGCPDQRVGLVQRHLRIDWRAQPAAPSH